MKAKKSLKKQLKKYEDELIDLRMENTTLSISIGQLEKERDKYKKMYNSLRLP